MSGMIEVVGGVIDEQGRTQLQRDVAAGLEQLAQRTGRQMDAGPAAPLLVDPDGNELATPLPDRKEAIDFMWDREAPPEWQRRLDGMFPPNDRISWLKIVWVAADEVVSRNGRVKADPVQRWVLFQMSRHVPPQALTFLLGPPPHAKQNPIPLMREQWDLYREFRCWAQPYWIIQGERGGHKRRFTAIESKILKAERRNPNAPPAGALPYAPFDQRVIDKIIAFDHVQFWNRAIELHERKPEDLDAEEQEAAKDARRFLLTWLDTQVERAIDEMPAFEIPTSRDAKPIDVDRATEKLLNQSY